MRRVTILFLLLFLATGNLLFAQTSFTDNFSDGDFTNNPQWYGDLTKYLISGTNNELQSNEPGVTGVSSLYVPVQIKDSCNWEFLVRLNLTTTGPSSSNRVRVYLQTNNSNFSSALNGYFLQIGETGSLDALEIFKVTNGTATSILRGTDGTVSAAVINTRVKIQRDNNGNWQLWSDHSGGTNFTLEGTATDATYNQGSFFGVQTTYSSTQATRFFYDDFSVSPLFVDSQAPVLVSASAISATQVDLVFDEAIDNITGSASLNYSIDNGIIVSNASVDLIDPTIVHLTCSALSNLQNYNVTATNVEDMSGNACLAQSQPFSFVLIQQGSFQDIIINEIMIDPNPVVGLPDAEFIELYNRSNKAINLSNYKISHQSTTSTAITQRTLGYYILQPNSYVFLHNNPAYVTASNDLLVPSLPALNNTAAYLVLKDSSGNLMDSILYEDTWYQDAVKAGGGWSLELINPNIICKAGNNWIASNDPTGGSPGNVNSVFDNSIDTSALQISLARQSDINKIYLLFNDVASLTAAQNTNNYAISNGLSVIFVQIISDREVELTLNANMINNLSYTVTINNIADCVGNAATNQFSFVYLETAEASHYDIIINEFLPDPTPSVGLPEIEFVELYNRSNKNINLEGFVFSDGTSSSEAIFPFYILKPAEYLIIYKRGTLGFQGLSIQLSFSTFPDLNVTEDDLTLYNRNRIEIDAISYESNWYATSSKAEGGWTLERINPNRPCEGRENWSESVAQPPLFSTIGGTPGAVNSVVQNEADLQSPSIITAYPFAAFNAFNGDTIRLFFSEAMGDSSSVRINNYDIDNGITVVEAWLEGPRYNSVCIITDLALQVGTTYTLTLSNGLTDCVGNSIALNNQIRFAKPEQINPGDLIINEILFNPVSYGEDYIELVNKSNKVLNLGDLWISNANAQSLLDANDIKTDYLVFPNQYVVLTDNPVQVYNQYQTQRTVQPDLNKMIKFDLPSFDDDQGTLVIYTAYQNTAVFIDSFTYSEDLHSALLDILDGVSLERINQNLPTNAKDNWHSAAAAVAYGTPTYINSSAVEFQGSGDPFIQIPNLSFSPDGDAYEDFLVIEYKTDSPGYFASMDIYDAHGRFVVNLLQNELLMQEGIVQWEGLNQKGERALTGPYILVTELLKPDGQKKVYKNTFVVAYRAK